MKRIGNDDFKKFSHFFLKVHDDVALLKERNKETQADLTVIFHALKLVSAMTFFMRSWANYFNAQLTSPKDIIT